MPNPGVLGFPRRWKRSAGGSGLLLPVGAADHDLLEVDGSELAAVTPVVGKYLRFKADGSGYEWVSPGPSGGSVVVDTYANRPTGANGAVFYPSDGIIRQVHDGTEWLNDVHGRLAPAPPVVSNWSWNNQSTSTATDLAGTIAFRNGGAFLNWRGIELSLPAAPYVFTACFRTIQSAVANQWWGMWWRDSATGALAINGFANASGTWGKYHSDWSNNTAFSAHRSSGNWGHGAAFGPCMWLQCEDDGTNRIARWGLDGVTWFDHPAVGNTSFLTADSIGFGSYEGGSFERTIIHLLSWKEES